MAFRVGAGQRELGRQPYAGIGHDGHSDEGVPAGTLDRGGTGVLSGREEDIQVASSAEGTVRGREPAQVRGKGPWVLMVVGLSRQFDRYLGGALVPVGRRG